MTASAAPPRPLMILRLLAGRGAYRVGVQAMSVALITVWGMDTYGHFANALGLCMWLLFVPTAAEKAALKLLPRTHRLRPAVASMTLRIAATPLAVLLVPLVIAVVVAPDSKATLYLTAACWQLCSGLLMTVSGLHRLRGRPALDATAFGVAAALIAGVTATTWLLSWSPHRHLLVLLIGLTVIMCVTGFAIPRAWVRGEGSPKRRLFPAFGRSTVLLGLTEILDSITVSVVFLVLAASSQMAASGPFYLVMMASGVICSVLVYQLKLHQPVTSARLRGKGAAAGRERAYTLLRTTELGGLAFGALLVVGLAIPGLRVALQADLGITTWALLAVLVSVEIALSILLLYAGFLLENTNSKILKLTAASAIVRLVATTAFALLLVPSLGATGGVASIGLAIAVGAFVLRRLLARQHPELTARPRTPAARPVPNPTTTS